MRSRVSVIVWDSGQDRMLTGTDGSLPEVPLTDDGWGRRLPAAFRREFGLECRLLDVAGFDLFVLDCDPAEPADDTGYMWRTVESAKATPIHPGARAWIERRFEPTCPWFAPDWYRSAIDYGESVIRRIGGHLTGRPEQLRHWAVSSVIMLPSSLGPFYLKTVPENDVFEPVLLDVCRKWNIPHCPEPPLARDASRLCWLSAEHPGTSGAALPESERLPAMTALAELQQASTACLDEFRAAGIGTVQPRDLAGLVTDLLDRDDLWSAQPAPHEHWRGLTDAQRRAWAGIGAWLIDSCHELADLIDQGPIRLAITHGDFHPGNTLHQGGEMIIHDWANASITHPFVDLGTWIDDMTEAGARTHLDAYLDAWSELADPGYVANSWRCAKPVSGLVALLRAIRKTEEFGPVRRHAMIAVIYGWVRRLIGAATDPAARIANWPPPP